MNDITLHDLVFVPFISAKEIEATVESLAKKVDQDYAGKNPTLLVVLNGAFVFAADFVRKISIPINIDFVKLSSYAGIDSSGKMTEHFSWQSDLKNRHVIIVEDIVDTGLTLTYLFEQLKARGPKSLKVCSLLHKPARMVKQVDIDYLGFTIDDVFVVGYGLDWAQKYRNLGGIGIVKNL